MSESEHEREDKEQPTINTATRRSVLTAAASLSLPAFLAATASANSVGSASNPYRITHADTITTPVRDNLPSNPDEGTLVVYIPSAST